ncbi:hypothetical protein VNO77_41768 [Canavalia gladiata]|uniref:Uncharacterized protein n=1 Tax=Canavalia gladiata TaxID=3824 RepID=A0AAN9K197_CANGL
MKTSAFIVKHRWSCFPCPVPFHVLWTTSKAWANSEVYTDDVGGGAHWEVEWIFVAFAMRQKYDLAELGFETAACLSMFFSC